MNKFVFTGEEKQVCGITVKRIRAERTFGDVQAGELGGWLESASNLEENGSAWVADEAVIMAFAVVQDDARVSGSARVSGWSRVRGNAVVADRAILQGAANVMGGIIGGDTVMQGSVLMSTPEFMDSMQ